MWIKQVLSVYDYEKEYRVLVARRPDEEQLETWRRGVVLEDGYKTAPAGVWLDRSAGKGIWLRVVMKEGRKRQIRETGSLLGLPVVKIIRVRIGALQLGGLKPREWRYLSQAEVAALKGQQVMAKPTTTKKMPALSDEHLSRRIRKQSSRSDWPSDTMKSPLSFKFALIPDSLS